MFNPEIMVGLSGFPVLPKQINRLIPLNPVGGLENPVGGLGNPVGTLEVLLAGLEIL